jgi:N-acetylglucosaminyldiphosphoundecaprenol N-acetyl-beta-D-mannosaminyltransferase
MSGDSSPRSTLPKASRAYRLGKRLLDLGVALSLLILMAPIMLFFLPWLMLRGQVSLPSREFIGPGAGQIRLHTLELPPLRNHVLSWLLRRLDPLPRILDLLAGRLTLVGPRPIRPAEVDSFGGPEHPRFGVVPGMVCLWWLRQRSNIDYGSEGEADLEYLSQRNLRRDLSILLRALVALAYGPSTRNGSACQFISGIRLLNLSMDSLLDAIDAALNRGTRTRIAFVNPDCVNIAARNARYRQTLENFDWVCADGIGMKIAGSLLGRPIRQNINGTDLFPRLCAALAVSGHSLYLLGARDGVAEATAQWARARYPELKIAGTHSGFFSAAEEPALVAEIRAARADVLLVAMGAPRQEQWLEAQLETTGALVGMGVGGLFDFYSGRIRRAPLWLREIGGEWVYRLLQEPGRMWRRYLVGNLVFLFRIMLEKFAGTNQKGPVV